MKRKFMTRLNRFDSCPNCGKDRCIEGIDLHNKKVNYSHMVDIKEMNNKVDYSKVVLSKFICTNCNITYPVLYENTKFPIPMVTDMMSIFLDEYFNKK